MNPESLFDTLLANAQDGDPVAQFNLGEYYRSPEVRSLYEAAEWFEKAAQQNHAQAQLALGLLYLEWLPDLKVGNGMLRHTEFLLTDFGESEMAIKDF